MRTVHSVAPAFYTVASGTLGRLAALRFCDFVSGNMRWVVAKSRRGVGVARGGLLESCPNSNANELEKHCAGQSDNHLE